MARIEVEKKYIVCFNAINHNGQKHMSNLTQKKEYILKKIVLKIEKLCAN